MLSTLIRLTTGGILLLALVGCPGGSVTIVTIDGGDHSIAIGSTLTLTATVTASTTVNVYALGNTCGALEGTGADGSDAFIPTHGY